MKKNRCFKMVKLFSITLILCTLFIITIMSIIKIIYKTNMKDYKIQNNLFAKNTSNTSCLSIVITQEYNARQIKIKLNATDNLSGVDKMCIQENSDVSKCIWKPYSSESFFTVSDNYNGATVIIYAWVTDRAGNVSDRFSTTYTTYKRCSKTINNGSSYCKNWGNCTKSCGGGIQYATSVQPKKDAYLGDTCTSVEVPNGCSQRCNIQDCCSSTIAGNWSACSEVCGKGTQSRTLYSAYDNSLVCRTETIECKVQSCCTKNTIKYGNWSSCSASCGGGKQTRKAYSTLKNNKRCSSFDESRDCNTQACDTTPNGTCKIRGSSIKTGGGSWTCSGGHIHSDGRYYQVYCKNGGTYTKASSSPTRVCPDSPFGPSEGWYIHPD